MEKHTEHNGHSIILPGTVQNQALKMLKNQFVCVGETAIQWLKMNTNIELSIVWIVKYWEWKELNIEAMESPADRINTRMDYKCELYQKEWEG